MKTVTLDGVEYALVPTEQLRPVDQPSIDATLAAPVAPQQPSSVFNDFLDQTPTVTPVDDGLATQAEKENAIRVVDPNATVGVPTAQPKPYAYRERFLKKEVSPADVTTTPSFSQALLAGNPEDPMIKADSKKPKSMQLFYGPGTQYEGY